MKEQGLSTLHKKFKYMIISFVAVLAMLIVGCKSVNRIDVGHVGVKIKLAGSTRGVQDMQVKTGWVFFNPLTEEIVKFPTKVETLSWTKDQYEGLKPGEKPEAISPDESLTFSSKEGIVCNADFAISFHIQADMANKLYSRFRQNDMHEIGYGYVRNTVRNNLNEITSKMTIQDIYGTGKTQMLDQVLADCRKILSDDGIIIDQFTLSGSLRLPTSVMDSINSAMAATQRAVESENKVRQIEAEATQKITQAKGEAEASRQKAQGEADALLTRTKAEAESRIVAAQSQVKANQMLQSTLTSQILQNNSINQWNGVLPTVNSGGAIPFVQIK